jgi:hypothetical protein
VVGLEGVRDEVAVGEHDALGRAGGPRGVEDGREVFPRVDPGPVAYPWPFQYLFEAQGALGHLPSSSESAEDSQAPWCVCGCLGDDQILRGLLGDFVQEPVEGDEGLGTGLCDLPGDLLDGVEGVDGDRDSARR